MTAGPRSRRERFSRHLYKHGFLVVLFSSFFFISPRDVGFGWLSFLGGFMRPPFFLLCLLMRLASSDQPATVQLYGIHYSMLGILQAWHHVRATETYTEGAGGSVDLARELREEHFKCCASDSQVNEHMPRSPRLSEPTAVVLPSL